MAIPAVTVAPVIVNRSPFDAVTVRLPKKWRSEVEAATVLVHGPPWSVVPAPGPELPAEALTMIPAA